MTNPQALEALRELVACKDLKDSAEAIHFAGPLGSAGDGWLIKYEAQRKEYIRRQPAAWAAAREVLAAPQPEAQASPAPAPRTLLEQYDLDQSEDYRKGYHDGRLKGYEVGHRHGKEQAERKPLTEPQIEQGRHDTFSTDNPFCPCDSKAMRKAVRWAERAHKIGLDGGM